MIDKNDKKVDNIQYSRRKFTTLMAWTLPTVSAVALPQHAQASVFADVDIEGFSIATVSAQACTAVNTLDYSFNLDESPPRWNPQLPTSPENLQIASSEGVNGQYIFGIVGETAGQVIFDAGVIRPLCEQPWAPACLIPAPIVVPRRASTSTLWGYESFNVTFTPNGISIVIPTITFICPT